MSFLSLLDNLNISLQELKSLSPKEIIKLEKKLKTKSRAKNNITSEEIRTTLFLIKNKQKQLLELYENEYFWFRKILSNPDKIVNFPLHQNNKTLPSKELKEFIEQHLTTSIQEYLTSCLNENHYRGLLSFLQFSSVFQIDTLDILEQNLNQKLVRGIAYVEQHPGKFQEKVEQLFNPFFYRCLNQFDHDKTNLNISLLWETVNNTLVIKKNIDSYRIAYAMGMYVSNNDRINEKLQELKKLGHRHGATEIHDKIKSPKGGTTINLYKPKKNQRKSSSGSSISFHIVVYLITAALAVMRLIDTCSTDSSYNSDNYERKVPENPSKKLREFIQKAKFIQQTSKVIQSNPVQFDAQHINFYPKSTSGHILPLKTYITNTTEKLAVFVVWFGNGYKYLFLESGETKTCPYHFTKYVIHRGKEPLAVYYIDENQEKQTGFAFNKFDQSDLKLLNTIHEKKMQSNFKQSWEIIISEESVEINEKS